MAQNLPYVTTVGTLEKMLEKIKKASVPDRFTQDFVNTKLAMKGGTPRAIIPFIKKLGLVAGDGTPTYLYLEFRNPAKSGTAMAKAMHIAYAPLFEMNEYASNLDDTELKGLIVEATGAAHDSSVVQKTVSTFSALIRMADFDTLVNSPPLQTTEHSAGQELEQESNAALPTQMTASHTHGTVGEGINLSYTVNLHLPPTTEIEVFNAIFRSLKEHLLRQ